MTQKAILSFDWKCVKMAAKGPKWPNSFFQILGPVAQRVLPICFALTNKLGIWATRCKISSLRDLVKTGVEKDTGLEGSKTQYTFPFSSIATGCWGMGMCPRKEWVRGECAKTFGLKSLCILSWSMHLATIFSTDWAWAPSQNINSLEILFCDTFASWEVDAIN